MNNRIVIASTLKPVDDVRAYWKIGQSISKTNKYEVNIIGNSSKSDSSPDNIYFHPHSLRRTQWLKRIIIRSQVLIKLFRIKPSILILCTHELLAIGLVYKLFARAKLIYDVQENYKQNAQMSSSTLGTVLSKTIRLKERLSSRFVDQFWLAEKCYENEIQLPKSRTLVIENKAFFHPIQREKSSQIRALFSGTISDYSGARLAMKVMQNLAKNEPDFEGRVVGQVHDLILQKWLSQQTKNHPTIELILSFDPIPYQDILDQISWANLGVISYVPNEVNRNKIPTKLYEYSRYRLPFLVQTDTTWEEIGLRLGGAIPHNFAESDISNLAKKVRNSEKLFPKSYPTADTWEYESQKIVDSINS